MHLIGCANVPVKQELNECGCLSRVTVFMILAGHVNDHLDGNMTGFDRFLPDSQG